MTQDITLTDTNGKNATFTIPSTTSSSSSEQHTHKPTWWKEALIYQIYPSSFYDSNGDGLGDIPGIIQKLDYLKDLGVDAIWLNPHYASPQVDMGYDISNYRDIYPPYGTLQDCFTFIEECHKRGMKVLFDLVINHCSDLHPWFQESRSSLTSPKRNWFMWRKPLGFNPDGTPIPPNNWRAAFGGSVWEWDEGTGEFYLHLFAVGQPDFNWEEEEVRKALYEEAVTFWLERGVDGFRIDTCNIYSKNLDFPDAPVLDPSATYQRSDTLWTNGPRLMEFLKEMNASTFSKHDAVAIGEWPNTPDISKVLEVVSAEAKIVDMVFQFDHVCMDFGKVYRFWPRDWKLSEFKGYIDQYQKVVDKTDGWQTTYLENHDQARSVTRYCSDAPEYRVNSAKMLSIFLLSMTGTTFVYQGQEIGTINLPMSVGREEYLDCETTGFWKDMDDYYPNDKEAHEKGRRGAQLNARDHGRFPVQWDSSPNGGFTTAEKPWMIANPAYKEINVADQIDDDNSVLSFYKKMIRFRKDEKDLMIYGAFRLIDKENDQTMIYVKEHGDKQAVIALNFTKEQVTFKLPDGLKGEAKLAISNYKNSSLETLEAFEGRVYLINA